MAWTEADVISLRAAVLALATGTRTVSVSFAGPPARAVAYQQVQLSELREILAEAEAEVYPSARQTFRLAGFSKGFYPRGNDE